MSASQQLISAGGATSRFQKTGRLQPLCDLRHGWLVQPGQGGKLCRGHNVAMPVRQCTKHQNGIVCQPV